jgi:hypothetical protein
MGFPKSGTRTTRARVVSADGKLLAVMTISDLLKGRSEEAHREGDRERVLRLRWPFGANHDTPATGATTPAPAANDIPPPDESGMTA